MNHLVQIVNSFLRNDKLNYFKTNIIGVGAILTVVFGNNLWFLVISIFIAYKIQEYQIIKSTDSSLIDKYENKTMITHVNFLYFLFFMYFLVKIIRYL